MSDKNVSFFILKIVDDILKKHFKMHGPGCLTHESAQYMACMCAQSPVMPDSLQPHEL